MNNNDNANLELLLREHLAQTEKLLSDMRKDFAEFRVIIREDMDNFKNEIRSDIKEFKTEIRNDMDNFKNEIRSDIKEFKTEIREDMDNFKNEIRNDLIEVKANAKVQNEAIVQINNKLTGIEHDITGLYHWDYWLLTIVIAVIAMPQIVNGIKSLFGAIADGLRLIISIFKGK